MNLKINKSIKKSSIWLIAGILLFVSIGFADKEMDTMVCGDVIIQITNQYDNYFIDEEDIIDIISHEGNLALVGNYVENLNLRSLETSLKNEKFIKDAQVYKDLKGNIIVTAVQRRPVARISRPDAPDAYIDEEGTILPLSDKFTSRVMLITGKYVDEFVEYGITDENKNYLDLIIRIESDPFWRAQVSQLDIEKSGEINVYPQVSKQIIEFGFPEDLDIKFKKMEIFYKEILPFKGWNTYARVNLKYHDQIICE
jgi:cell division protein FtsQ